MKVLSPSIDKIFKKNKFKIVGSGTKLKLIKELVLFLDGLQKKYKTLFIELQYY